MADQNNDDCKITDAQKAASDANTEKAVDAGDSSGINAKLEALVNQAQQSIQAVKPGEVLISEPIGDPELPAAVLAKGSKRAIVKFFLEQGYAPEAAAKLSQKYNPAINTSYAKQVKGELDKIAQGVPLKKPKPKVLPIDQIMKSPAPIFAAPTPPPVVPAVPQIVPPGPMVANNKRAYTAHYIKQGLSNEAVYKEVIKTFPEMPKSYVQKIRSEMVKAGQLKTFAPGAPAITVAPKAPPTPTKFVQVQGPDEKTIMGKEIHGPLGSNAGGLYEGTDGTKRYVKFYQEPGQAYSEVVSNEVYRRLGLSAPESSLFKHSDGLVGFASKWTPDVVTLGKKGLTKALADKVLDGFAADVLTVNWDAVGTGLDNVVITKAGEIMRVDQGGTLYYRAKGKLKPGTILSNINEWETLRTQNAYYAQVFQAAGITSAEEMGTRIIKQIDDIEKLRNSMGPGGFAQFAKSLGVPAQQAAKIGSLLNTRVDMLIQKRTAIGQLAKEAEALKEQVKQYEKAGLQYSKIPNSSVASWKLQLKDNPKLMVVTDAYGSNAAIVSRPPAELVKLQHTGVQKIAQWYGKHIPTMSAEHVNIAIAQLGLGAPGTIAVEKWMAEGLTGTAIPQTSHHKSGFLEGEEATGKLNEEHGSIKRKKTNVNDVIAPEGSLRSRLSSDEINGLRSYAGANYQGINSALRAAEPGAKTGSKYVGAIDRAMKVNRLDADVVLYRGIKSPHPLNEMSLSQLAKSQGAIFTEKGYGSHSTRRATAEGFSGKHRILRVHAKGSIRGIWMPGAGTGVGSENEFLMARASTFRVLGVSESEGYIVIDVELVEQLEIH